MNKANQRPGGDPSDGVVEDRREESAEARAAAWAEWNAETQRIKRFWVISVVAFWVTAGIQVAVYFINGRLEFLLLSIALGMMALGVWFKSRLQLHLRREPGRRGT